jgi:signal transduction histidine kinase
MTEQQRAPEREERPTPASGVHVQPLPPDADYVRTEFLQRIAHDLRGHAGVIHGALQELEVALGDQAGAQPMFFGMAKRGVKRILRLAERLQQTGQLARAAPALTSSDCDLRVLVQQAAEDAEAIESRKKITIEVDLPGAAVACVADGHWLSAAFFELTSNAVRNATARVWISLQAVDANHVTLTFTDDGKESAEFGPTRFKAPRDRRGLGLGLSIVHRVIEAHDGTITASNCEDGGA